MNQSYLKSHYYFVDEAGTPDIWGRRSRDILIGQGQPRYFIMGLADIRDVTTVSNAIDFLRHRIVNDPELSQISSVRSPKKTSRQFHGKDDHDLVRDQVFDLLCKPYHNIQFYAVVCDKQRVLDAAVEMRRVDPSYRYSPNNLYDRLVRRLFSGRLHFRSSRFTTYFARRSHSDRQQALTNALHQAQRDFEQHKGLNQQQPSIRFISGYPYQYQGLQVVDYFCWALQRLYERNESFWWNQLWNAGKIRCVIAEDDTSRTSKGEIYTAKNPLLGRHW